MAKVEVKVIYGNVNGVPAGNTVEVDEKSIDKLVKNGFIEQPVSKAEVKEAPAKESKPRTRKAVPKKDEE